jgi:hypothetical protein
MSHGYPGEDRKGIKVGMWLRITQKGWAIAHPFLSFQRIFMFHWNA